MKAKVIQNVRNRMEAQINRMKPQIRKTEENFNKDVVGLENRKQR